MALVAFPFPEHQPVACSACAKRAAYRANAGERFMRFEARFATTGVSRRQLRAVYAVHADTALTESLLVLAWHGHLSGSRMREITKSFNPRRCSSEARCWLHIPPKETADAINY